MWKSKTVQERSRRGTDGQLKFFSTTMPWPSSTSFPYSLTGITPTPLLLGMIKVILSLAGKAGGIGMAFQLAKITILGSSKMTQVGARCWNGCQMRYLGAGSH